MTLIATPVYDTEENGRAEVTLRCLTQLRETLSQGDETAVYNNGSCRQSRENLDNLKAQGIIDHLYHGEKNIGVAKAINFLFRRHGTPDGIKTGFDSDCFVHDKGWTDVVREVFRRCPEIGLISLKEPIGLEHGYGELDYAMDDKPAHWIPIEYAHWPLGTCQSYRQELLAKIGYLTQPTPLYGFSDILLSVRAEVAGFKTIYLPHIRIDHHDDTGPYQEQKGRDAGEYMAAFDEMKDAYMNGTLDIYYEGE